MLQFDFMLFNIFFIDNKIYRYDKKAVNQKYIGCLQQAPNKNAKKREDAKK